MAFSEAELIERRKFLGASEAGAAVGESPWFSRLELYLSKKGELPPIETTLPMMIGTALEPICLEMCERETGMTIESRQQVFIDQNAPWRRCTLDGYVHSENILIEAKTSGDFRGWGEPGTDEIPLHYIFNAAHSMLVVKEARKVIFPVIIGRGFKMYEVQRNKALLELVAEAEADFMQLVVSSTPPPPRDRDDLKLRYPRSLGVTKVTTPEVNAALQALVETKDKIKGLKTAEDELSFRVTSHMGTSETLIGAGGDVLATWKSQDRKEFITKASSFRVLRVK